ncbi:hypothetical protein I3760_15G028900 [Carya illinoinensis]|nr:hypothetical protein I3760_15G028900 [Carya illinoinensis]
MSDEEGTGTGDGTYCAEGLKSEAVKNGSAIGNGNEWNSGGSKHFRTYKRRKHVRSSSDGRAQQDWRVCAEAASQLTEQTLKEPGCTVIEKNSIEEVHLPMDGSDTVHRGTGEMLYWSTCIGPQVLMKLVYGDALGRHLYLIMELMVRWWLRNLAIVMKTGSKLHKHSACRMDRRKQLMDMQYHKLEDERGAYEHSPVLFSSDIEQVWRKLQEIGSEFVSLAKNLSDMSRTAYHEQVGGRVHSTYEVGEHEFLPRESDSPIKPVQTEDCGVFKVCTCRQCGRKADGRDYLLCDSCEEMYHVSCIEPAIKEIPPKSWYCTVCTSSRVTSPHQNCEVCDRLIAPKSPSNGGDDETSPINEETSIDMEENSNCSMDNGLQPSKGGKNSFRCKICGNEVEDGEKLKACGHSFCPNKYYHARCLTTKQLKSYGPRWYCPSCLCRVCLADQDDDKIILCDGCDHAYHIYCMKPPRTSIPRGKWFCRKCNAGIQAIRRAKRAYETKEIKHRKKGVGGLCQLKILERDGMIKEKRHQKKVEGWTCF